MSKRCPPGVICIENITLVTILVIIIGSLCYLNYFAQPSKVYIKKDNLQQNTLLDNSRIFGLPTFNDIPAVLTNPHVAPLRDNHYHPRGSSDVRGVPINVPTQTVESPFRQIGILTRVNGPTGENILPLMGRPLYIRRDKWNFYTMNDKNNMIKLPIVFKGVNGMNEYGCDNIYNGDIVYVEGYQDSFKATIYETNTLRYIPC